MLKLLARLQKTSPKKFRDVIAHNYFGIKIETVWAVVVEEIPILRPALEKLLSDIKKENI
jgi:uncharacterized protein with HEPN domain